MNRTEMRENAFKLIYSLEIQKVENVQEQINLYFESNNITDEEAKKIYSKCSKWNRRTSRRNFKRY